MEIRNYNEPAVREEVARSRSEGRSPVGACWCPLCESDMISLALSSLPPCYGRDTSASIVRGMVTPAFVRAAVSKAVERVSRRPKHPPGLSNYLYYQVRVVNFAFEEGAAHVGRALEHADARCRCRACRADTLALALNRFPPLYGVDCDGRVGLPSDRRRLYGEEMGHALTAAARVVAGNPQH